jgi:allophanate hydrolase subunit 1
MIKKEIASLIDSAVYLFMVYFLGYMLGYAFIRILYSLGLLNWLL